MKFSKLLRTSAVIAAAVFAFGTVQAQSPDQQVGVGINTDANFYVAYALNPAIHIGLALGYINTTTTVSSGTTSADVSSSAFVIGPYGKFLFMGTPVFKPFVDAQFAFGSASVENPGTSTTTTISTSAILVGGGAEYFVSRNLGIYAKVRLLQFDLSADPDASGVTTKETIFGISNAAVGVEWFF